MSCYRMFNKIVIEIEILGPGMRIIVNYVDWIYRESVVCVCFVAGGFWMRVDVPVM